MDKDSLIVKDWEMAINETTNLSNTIITLRVQGIPIAVAILAIGYVAYQYVHGVTVFGVSALTFIPLFGSIYLLMIAMIDAFYFNLMLASEKRAMAIEERSQGNFNIMTVLTTPTRTMVHEIITIVLYAGLIIFGVISTYFFLTH
jgi:hypothetical protein